MLESGLSCLRGEMGLIWSPDRRGVTLPSLPTFHVMHRAGGIVDMKREPSTSREDLRLGWV